MRVSATCLRPWHTMRTKTPGLAELNSAARSSCLLGDASRWSCRRPTLQRLWAVLSHPMAPKTPATMATQTLATPLVPGGCVVPVLGLRLNGIGSLALVLLLPGHLRNPTPRQRPWLLPVSRQRPLSSS